MEVEVRVFESAVVPGLGRIVVWANLPHWAPNLTLRDESFLLEPELWD
jgi:hypothetical protein